MRRRAFTLVELLVVIAVIAVLSAITYGAIMKAMIATNEARTKQLIVKIDRSLTSKWEAFRLRRLALTMLPTETTNQFAARRLDAIRDLQRLEMPECYDDIVRDPVALQSRSALSARYLDIYNKVRPSTQYEDAECLYLICTMGSRDDRVSQSDDQVGDLDNDGMFEYLDGWGRPIHFLRWAPGFVSEIQPFPQVQLIGEEKVGSTGNIEFDTLHGVTFDHHSPFDQRRLDSRAFALKPLIWSDGADLQSGLVQPTDSASRHTRQNLGWPDYDNNGYSVSYNRPPVVQGTWSIDPYRPVLDAGVGKQVYAGDRQQEELSDGSFRRLSWNFDNIHNHKVNVR